MLLLHCKKCHHEWEGDADDRCDWCGAGNIVLQEQTDFEHFLRTYNFKDPLRRERWLKERKNASRKINI